MAPSSTTRGKKKPGQKTIFHRISAWLHLWLGLASGLIMFVVCLTACIWVFEDEITAMMNPETQIAKQDKPVMTPSQLMHLGDSLYPGKKPNYAMYHQGEAVTLVLGAGRTGNTVLRVNPFTSEVVSRKQLKEGEVDFFRFILNGHRFLWLPPAIGRPIVNYGTLIFMIILITGLVLWWPKKWTKATRDQSFKIKWNASFKRVNYDVHNVFGFYSMIFLLAIGFTGMVYGIQWWSNGLYWITAGGNSLPVAKRTSSDSLNLGKFYTPAEAMDQTWKQIATAHPDAQGFYYSFADTSRPSSPIAITIYPTAGHYYNNRSFSFDQHTAKQLKGNKMYEQSFEAGSIGTKIRRMNYEIHIGSILGLPGKILAFFAALVGASLPITGFLVWWGKRRKKTKKPVNRAPMVRVRKSLAEAGVS